jgi:hypothetical protein
MIKHIKLKISFILEKEGLILLDFNQPMNVGPCHHGMARSQVADGGTASYMEGSSE